MDERQLWEGSIQRSWDGLHDEGGKLTLSDDRRIDQRQPKISRFTIRRGMIRYLYLLLDMSQAMERKDSDFRPDRAGATRHLLKSFVADFFAQNPLANLGILVMRNGEVETLTELSGSKRPHIDALDHDEKKGTRGEASLQKGLDVACSHLKEIPDYGHR